MFSEETSFGRRGNPPSLTGLPHRMRWGDLKAEAEVWQQVYPELHRLAGRYRRNERRDHSLSPTELINEAYLQIIKQRHRTWQSRAHFLGVAAHVMRRVLVDYARRHRAGKRGGAHEKLDLGAAPVGTPECPDSILDLHNALEKLGTFDPRQRKIVELRFFDEMTDAEIAQLLGIGVRTVTREWSLAKAWLYGELHSRAGRER